ncbi:hypothetical protein [Streptomyces sp. NPDC086023]|uniref:hypothetical protein n=1 Tax=Streptomyces sp. NPDC086023 TaxID=3365746 RepID=UPI0037D5C3B8
MKGFALVPDIPAISNARDILRFSPQFSFMEEVKSRYNVSWTLATTWGQLDLAFQDSAETFRVFKGILEDAWAACFDDDDIRDASSDFTVGLYQLLGLDRVQAAPQANRSVAAAAVQQGQTAARQAASGQSTAVEQGRRETEPPTSRKKTQAVTSTDLSGDRAELVEALREEALAYVRAAQTKAGAAAKGVSAAEELVSKWFGRRALDKIGVLTETYSHMAAHLPAAPVRMYQGGGDEKSQEGKFVAFTVAKEAIYLGEGFFEKDRTKQAIILMHESAHYVNAQIKDHGNSGSTPKAKLQRRAGEDMMGTIEALTCAYNLQYFAEDSL